jgi:hypothetical protein
VFAGWSGGCSGTASTCAFSVDAATSITASFALKTFVLSVDVQGTGTGSVTSEPSGIICGSECEEEFIIDSEVTLTAQPDADSLFVGWGGACGGSQETCTVTMSDAMSVTVSFDVDEAKLFMPLLDKQ